MGLIDVTELLNDPDFVQPLTIIKRTPVVDNYGQNVLTECPSASHGSIQPISGKTLLRIPEAFRVANIQSFWVKEKIITDSREKYPDILVKNGVRFVVQFVFDWSDWGSGWNEGVCVQERPTL